MLTTLRLWVYVDFTKGELDHDILYGIVGVGISGSFLTFQLRSFRCFTGVWFGSFVFMVLAKGI